MKRHSIAMQAVLVCIILFISSAAGTTFYSKGSLAVNIPSSWNTARDGTGSDAVSFTGGHTWVIQATHQMSLSGSSSWDVTPSGVVQIEADGTWDNSSAGAVQIGTFEMLDGGSYVHATGNGTIPGDTRIFSLNSSCEIRNQGTSSISTGITWGNVTINIANESSASIANAASFADVRGNFAVVSTQGQEYFLMMDETTPHFFGGNLDVHGGTLVLKGGSGSATVSVAGNLSLFVGTIRVSEGGPVTLNVAGNLSISEGVLDGGATSACTINVGSNWTNDGTFNAGLSTVTFNGGAKLQTISSLVFTQFHNLVIENPFGASLAGGSGVEDILSLVQSKIALNNSRLTIGASGTIVRSTDTNYIVTNASGMLVRNSVGGAARTFPIGTPESYNPVTITNAGDPDNFAARVQGTFDVPPSQPNNVVNRQWTLSEATAGGSNATISFQWGSADQAPGFSIANPVVIGQIQSGTWFERSATAGGADPYIATVSGISTFSAFGVGNTSAFGSASVVASVKALLEGPYNAATTRMLQSLKTTGVLGLHFPSVVMPGGVVDSVTVELRDSASGSASTIRKYRPAWILTDGTIRSFDDTSLAFVRFDAPTGNYYIVVHQRNHLSIMTATSQVLGSSTSPTPYDFTLAQASAFGANPMRSLGGGLFGMYAGDADQSGVVTASDANALFGELSTVGYSNDDTNLSGIITAADANRVFANLNAATGVP